MTQDNNKTGQADKDSANQKQQNQDQNRSAQQGSGPADKNQQSQGGQKSGQQGSSVGKDTDNDGRAVQPGHKPGEVDGNKQKNQTQNR